MAPIFLGGAFVMAVGYFLVLAVRDVARGFRTGAAAA